VVLTNRHNRRCRRPEFRPCRADAHGFALVIALLLVTLLAAASVGLGTLVSTESIVAGHIGRDLDHELAVDSVLQFVPHLADSSREFGSSAGPSVYGRTVTLALPGCEVYCVVQREAEKVQLARARPEQLMGSLSLLARRYALPGENLNSLPIRVEPWTATLPRFVWFDQIVSRTEFEEVFHWTPILTGEVSAEEHTTWSDVVSLWGNLGAELGLTITTAVGSDVRRWYVVVALAPGGTRVFYRGPIS